MSNTSNPEGKKSLDECTVKHSDLVKDSGSAYRYKPCHICGGWEALLNCNHMLIDAKKERDTYRDLCTEIKENLINCLKLEEKNISSIGIIAKTLNLINKKLEQPK